SGHLLRVAFAVASAVTAALFTWIFWSTPRSIQSDLAPVWAGARALLDGHDPYASVGPGRAFDTTFPLMYPMTAVLTMTPLLLAASFAISPAWVAEWRAGFVTVPHIVAPITRWGGPLLLLALTKWKRADARLLLGLACVPHTTALYETIPLFLIAETWLQAWGLWALAIVVYVGQWATGPYPSVSAHWGAGQQWIVAAMYLPCLAVVLTRRNEWTYDLRLPWRADDRRGVDAELLVVREVHGAAAAQHSEEADARAEGVLR